VLIKQPKHNSPNDLYLCFIDDKKFKVIQSSTLDDTAYDDKKFKVIQSSTLDDTAYDGKKFKVIQSSTLDDTAYDDKKFKVILSSTLDDTAYDDKKFKVIQSSTLDDTAYDFNVPCKTLVKSPRNTICVNRKVKSCPCNYDCEIRHVFAVCILCKYSQLLL